jgi:hypothetical protein
MVSFAVMNPGYCLAITCGAFLNAFAAATTVIAKFGTCSGTGCAPSYNGREAFVEWV